LARNTGPRRTKYNERVIGTAKAVVKTTLRKKKREKTGVLFLRHGAEPNSVGSQAAIDRINEKRGGGRKMTRTNMKKGGAEGREIRKRETRKKEK